jgi:phage I-like protein
MKTVFAALSLKDNATEAEALGAVVRINDSHRKLLAAIGKESADEAVGFVTALKAKSENYDALATELETVKAEKLAVEATALLDEAVKDGRVSHAKRPEFEALHKECGLKALKVCLAALPKSAEPARPPSSAPAAPSAALDPDQIKLAKLTGVSVEDREKHRQVLRASRGISKEQE